MRNWDRTFVARIVRTNGILGLAGRSGSNGRNSVRLAGIAVATQVIERLEARQMLCATCGCDGGVSSGLAVRGATTAALVSGGLLPASTVLSPSVSSSQHVGDSPFDPPFDQGGTIVVDTDQPSALDTGCVFVDEGPLNINIPVDRVVGDLQKLSQVGITLPDTVTLKLPAYDVDYVSDDASKPPERDAVTFVDKDGVGHSLGFLQGADGTWFLNTFQIQTSWIDFASSSNSTVNPGQNTLRIDIDTASGGERNWCTEIDWVAIEVPPIRPVLFVHGILSGPSTWDGSDWTNELSNLGIPWEEIDLTGTIGLSLESIGTNAAKIADRVEQMKSTYHTDKVNIVAHSKGGLDSRAFAEVSDSVDTLIQLDTPNAGSELADLVQGGLGIGSLLASGSFPIATLLANAGLSFFAPAAEQLTTGYMADYNASHGLNPDVHYYAIAGDYTSDSPLNAAFFQNLFNDGSAYDGRNSEIVGNWSVYSIPGMNDVPAVVSVGADGQAKHTGIIHSDDAYQALKAHLFAATVGSASNSIQSFSTQSFSTMSLNPSAQTGQAATLNASTPFLSQVAAGATVTGSIVLDDTSAGAAITMTYGLGNLDLTLISPTGVVVTPAQLPPGVNFSQDESTDGFKTETYAFQAGAEAGSWTVQVAGTSVTNASGSQAFLVSGLMGASAIKVAVDDTGSAYQVNQSIPIRLRVTNAGAGLAGASVRAAVLKPDQTESEVLLFDDGTNGDDVAGDGVYNGAYSGANIPGTYTVAASASGTAPTSYSRQAQGMLVVSSGASSLSGTYSSNAVDSNSNGLYDRLEVNVGVQAAGTGTYKVQASLADANGQVIQTVTKTVDLSAGNQNVTLGFDGAKIYDHSVDGPYQVMQVHLWQVVNDIDADMGTASNVHTTQAYSVSDFEHKQIRGLFNGSYTTPDVDADGKFDSLDITASVAFDVSGTYTWSGELLDTRGRVVSRTSNTGQVSTGANNLSFSFSGTSIWSSGIDGPYTLGNIVVVGPNSDIIDRSGVTTAALLSSEFEPGANLQVSSIDVPQAVFTGQTADFTYTVTNTGSSATEASAWQDQVYLSTDGVLDGTGDTLLETLDHSGSLAVGESYTQTASYTVPTGTAYLIVKSDVANAVLEGSGESDNVTVKSAAPSGPPQTFGGKTSIKFTDADGDKVTVSLKGPGTGTLSLSAGVDNADIVSLVVDGATSKTTLNIKASGKGTTVGQIAIHGNLGSLSASKADLAGDIDIDGGVSKFTVRNASGGRTLTIGSGSAGSFSFANVNNFNLHSSSVVKSLKVKTWADDDSTPDVVASPEIDSLSSSGDFAADLTGDTLKKFSTKNALHDADLRFTSSIGSLSAKTISNTRLFAGVDSDITTLPTSSSAFSNSGATIKSVSIKSKSPGAFSNSLIVAPVVSSLSLGSLLSGNGGTTYGVATDQIGSLKASTDTFGKISKKKLTTGDTFSVGDFFVRLI